MAARAELSSGVALPLPALRPSLRRVQIMRRTFGTGEIYLLIRMIFNSLKAFIKSILGVWFQPHTRQRRYRFAPTRPSQFYQPDYVSAGDSEQLPGGAKPKRAGLEELLWRLVCRGCNEAPPESHPCEPACATSSLTGGTKRMAERPTTSPMLRVCWRRIRWWASLFSTQITPRICWVRGGAGVGSFRRRQDGHPGRLRDVLLTD